MFKHFRTLLAPARRGETLTNPATTERTAPAIAPEDLAQVVPAYVRRRQLRSTRSAAMKTSALALVVALAVGAMSGDAPAQSNTLACGTTYTIANGDSLFQIARRAYGDGSRFQAILTANAPVLTNTSVLDVGDKILLPCLDGSGPQTREAAAAMGLLEAGDSVAAVQSVPQPAPAERRDAPIEPTAAAAPDPAANTVAEPKPEPPVIVRAVSGPDFAPFSGPELAGGGLIPTLVAAALGTSGAEVDLTFAERPPVRLDMLAPGADRDLGYPFFRPDCQAGTLTQILRRQCDDFAFSDPVYAIPVGVYVRKGDALLAARNLAGLTGKRICRPAEHFTFDLEQAGLTGNETILTLADSAEVCFRALAQGHIDAVTMARHPVAPILRRLRLTEKVTEVTAMRATPTLHVIADRTNAEAMALLERVNRGMEELRTSGAWFEAVLAYEARRGALVN